MTPQGDHKDAQLDAALEAIARPDPPAGHIARVLARTSGAVEQDAGVGLVRRVARRPSLRVTLAAAATVLVALAVMNWPVARAPVVLPDAVAMRGSEGLALDGPEGIARDGSESRPSHRGMAAEIVEPVLPPEAYWAMDAFEEWRRLRPGSGVRVPGSGDGVPVNAYRAARSERRRAGDDELAWDPVPSGLPAITLTSILPPPLELPSLDEPAPIALEPITLAPIELAPLDEQEKP